MVSGQLITHSINSPNVVISGNGIYQVLFSGSVAPLPNTTLPASIIIYLTINGSISSIGATQTFTSLETDTISFQGLIEVTDVPVTLNVLVENSGFIFSSITITVIRLGNVN